MADEEEEKKSGIVGYGCAVLFLLPFLIVGLVATGIAGKSLVDSARMLSWQETPATLHTIKVHKKHDGDAVSYSISCSYSYSFNGETFAGSAVGHTDKGGFGVGLKQRRNAARQASKNGALSCYVNPQQPAQAVLFRGVLWDQFVMLLIFGVLFGGVGGGGLYAVFFRKDPAIEEERLRKLHPDEPWRHRQQWASDEIHTTMGSQTTFYWLFAIAWNLISCPMLIVVPEEWADGNKAAVLGLIFPLVGVCLLWMAVRRTLVGVKFGKPSFAMTTVPGVLGGELVGTIRVPRALDTQQDIPVTLSCIRCESSGRGDNRSSVDRARWQAERLIKAGELERVGWGVDIPVAFTIPYDLPDSSADNITWKLSAEADVPGLDFITEFEVPVFKTADSDASLTTGAVASRNLSMSGGTPADTKIRVMKRDGKLRIIIPTALTRRFTSVFGFAVFVLVWTGALFLQYHLMPLAVFLFFGGVTGLIELILLLVLWGMVFTRHDVLIDRNGIRDRNKTQIPASSIKAISHSMSSQSNSGNKVKAHYKLCVSHDTGSKTKETVIGDFLSQQEAVWLQEEIEAILTSTDQ